MLLPSLKAGKHVHCEKPLGISVEQDLAARKAVRKYKKIFQYGAELRAFPEAKKGIELVLNGRIGKVQKIYAVSDCGVVINSSGALQQVMGGITDGYGTAMYGKLSFRNGEPEQKNFDRYRLVRMKEIFDIDASFVNNGIDAP